MSHEFDEVVQQQLRKRRAARMRWLAYGGLVVLAGASWGGYQLMSRGKNGAKPAASVVPPTERVPVGPKTEVPGRALVVMASLPPQVKVEALAPTTAATRIEASAKVAFDDNLIARVKPGVSGWIESLHVKGGARVKAGQPIVTLFSRQLVTAEQDYLETFVRLVGLGRQPGPAVAGTIKNERAKLAALGMSAGEIATIEKTGVPMSTLVLKAPRAGNVKLRGSTVASAVEPANEAFSVGETTSMWVVALVPETEARALKPGTPARVTFPGLASLDTNANVTAVVPTAGEPRWSTVRITVPNKSKALRVGIDAHVSIQVPPRPMLLMPRSAVIDDWAMRHVFVESSGTLAPRKVLVGAKVGESLEIVEGLKAGDRVVIAGAELIDKASSDRGGPK